MSSIANTTRGVALHWNGKPMGLLSCRGDRCAATWAAIKRWQTTVRQPPFRDIAYTWGVCPGCGRKHEGRGWGVRTAANGTNAGNRDWHAVMVMYGLGEPYTQAAKASVLELHAEHRRIYGHGILTTHTAVRNGTTDCPGKDGVDWVKAGGPLDMDLGDRLLALTDPYMRGPDVRAWQRMIGVADDGVFGPDTDETTRLYQALLGVKADGIVGPATLAATQEDDMTPEDRVLLAQAAADAAEAKAGVAWIKRALGSRYNPGDQAPDTQLTVGHDLLVTRRQTAARPPEDDQATV